MQIHGVTFTIDQKYPGSLGPLRGYFFTPDGYTLWLNAIDADGIPDEGLLVSLTHPDIRLDGVTPPPAVRQSVRYEFYLVGGVWFCGDAPVEHIAMLRRALHGRPSRFDSVVTKVLVQHLKVLDTEQAEAWISLSVVEDREVMFDMLESDTADAVAEDIARMRQYVTGVTRVIRHNGVVEDGTY